MTSAAADEPARPILPPPIPDGLDATLVLLRHGESEWVREGRFQGQGDSPLSDLGRRQAALAARRLANPHAPPPLPIPAAPPTEIVHSPLARTTQTAAEVRRAMAGVGGAGTNEIEVRPDAGLLEIGQGDWEGRHHDEIMHRWGSEIAAWRRRPTEAWAPGGESLAQVQARVAPALQRLTGRLAEGREPGTLDRSQVSGYQGTAPAGSQPWALLIGHDGVFKIVLLTLFGLPLQRFWMFSFALCGITVVEIRAGRAVLVAHSLTEHLAPLLDEASIEAAERRARSGAL
jgi:broad specificity phosphatase PhoE